MITYSILTRYHSNQGTTIARRDCQGAEASWNTLIAMDIKPDCEVGYNVAASAVLPGPRVQTRQDAENRGPPGQ